MSISEILDKVRGRLTSKTAAADRSRREKQLDLVEEVTAGAMKSEVKISDGVEKLYSGDIRQFEKDLEIAGERAQILSEIVLPDGSDLEERLREELKSNTKAIVDSERDHEELVIQHRKDFQSLIAQGNRLRGQIDSIGKSKTRLSKIVQDPRKLNRIEYLNVVKNELKTQTVQYNDRVNRLNEEVLRQERRLARLEEKHRNSNLNKPRMIEEIDAAQTKLDKIRTDRDESIDIRAGFVSQRENVVAELQTID